VDRISTSNCRQYAMLLSIALLAAANSQVAWAQAAPDPINQPLSDEYGVERKSGRLSVPLPQIIDVGGKGREALAVAFTEVDGSYVVESTRPRRVINEVIPPWNVSGPPQIYERYLVNSINYGGVSERFRQMWVGPYSGGSYSGPWTSEYPTGSTYDGKTLITKDGIRIEFANYLINPYYIEDPSPVTVKHPDGVEIYFSDGRSVRNNFGYAIDSEFENVRNVHGFPFYKRNFRAVNLAETYCDISSPSLCAVAGVQRNAALEVVEGQQPTQLIPSGRSFPEQFLFTDASGGVTRLRNRLFEAFRYRPVCGSYSGFYSCSTPPVDSRPYPVGLTLPGSGSEVFTYSYMPVSQVGSTGIVHDDVRISRVVANGVTVDYEPTTFTQGGSPGATFSYGPSWFRLRSLIAGSEISYTESFQLYPWWGQSRRTMLYSTDELGRRTSYSFNALWEVNAATYPEGNRFAHGYDARQNIISVSASPKTGSSDPALVTTFSYANDCVSTPQTWCNKPLSMTDPRGGVTNFEYNQYGQLTRQISPAPAVGAPRPTLVNEYTSRTAFVKNSAGAPVPAGPPISLLTRSYTCFSSAACNAASPASDKVVTDYDYGPPAGLNNLKLRGIAVTAANGLGQIETQRTCYTYDYFGQRVSETKSLGTGATCP
jgi:YD repeat-containing protein